MSRILPLLLLSIFSLSICLFDLETYEKIKSKVPFEVLEYEEHKRVFEGTTLEDLKLHNGENHLLSKEILDSLEERKQKTFLDSNTILKGSNLPTEFDWRKVKPDCFTPVKDQKNCGGCYAFSATAVLETRYCIASNGKLKPELSQQDIISCDNNNNKCKGDKLDNTWRYLERVGTCSLYCKPYQSAEGFIPACSDSCYDPKFSLYRWKAKADSWVLLTDPESIKAEIYMNGPVSAVMQTFEDFSLYKGGIYVHVEGAQTDYHAVVILGWGFDKTYNKEYWILRNSWGPKWGEQGYFKILHGSYMADAMANASQPFI